jgi:hypothetical protein
MNPDFYLVAREGTPYEPKACYIKKKLIGVSGAELALVQVLPPFGPSSDGVAGFDKLTHTN